MPKKCTFTNYLHSCWWYRHRFPNKKFNQLKGRLFLHLFHIGFSWEKKVFFGFCLFKTIIMQNEPFNFYILTICIYYKVTNGIIDGYKWMRRFIGANFSRLVISIEDMSYLQFLDFFCFIQNRKVSDKKLKNKHSFCGQTEASWSYIMFSERNLRFARLQKLVFIKLESDSCVLPAFVFFICSLRTGYQNLKI